jgi:hypothetical protein
MARKSRQVLIDELNLLSNHRLSIIESNINNCWGNLLNKYKGVNINVFPDAIKAGEITISDCSNNNSASIFPRLKAKWNVDCPKTSSSYNIVVDNLVVKIGALKDGVKSDSFNQYLSGISGSPSRRSCGVYTFLAAMLKLGKKIDVYHVTMNSTTNIDIPTINGVRKSEIHYSPSDIEKTNILVYKEHSEGKAPLLNLKERNATYPREFDELYDLINKRVLITKKYTE